MKGFLKCFGKRILSKSKEKKAPPEITVETPGEEKHPLIRELKWEEIERSTANFSRSRVIGSGGFSTVYLADNILQHPYAAAKIVYGRRVFEEELEILQKLRHGNIVRLIGYSRSDSDDQVGALVTEYAPNGTLQEKLSSPTSAIPWSKRVSIACELAEALEYLHDRCGALPIVHGDIKASNLLLDHNLTTRVCDFGSAKMGFSAAVAVERKRRITITGSPGYTDPHYLRTGIASKKNDVYSFGVVLLHLVTGAQPFFPATGQLLGPIQSLLARLDDRSSDPHSVADFVDPRLFDRFDPQQALALLCLSARCLRSPPTLRPSASEILHTISSTYDSPLLFSESPLKY